MSPLARIRQVAACTVFLSFAGFAQAADALSPSQQAPSQQVPSQQVPSQQAPSQQAPSTRAQPAPVTAPLPAQSAQPVQLSADTRVQIAHSALLAVEGTLTADTLRVNILRARDKSVIGGDDVTVAIDGKNQSVTHEKGGGYELPVNDLRGGGARDVDITVGHDGIREIVSARVSVIEGASANSLLRDHKQIAWWILNIVIVLIAAIAISRRKT